MPAAVAGQKSGRDATIAVEGLTKIFYDESRGELRAVDGIDFECHAGEIFGLLGANGAGKTTTLRMLATILKPTAGRARLMGHEVVTEPESVRANLGFSCSTTAAPPTSKFPHLARSPSITMG